MKKKLWISMFAFICIICSIFIVSNHIHASTSYKAGGNVSGRVNIAPSNTNFSGDNIGLQKGDKILMGTKSSPTTGSTSDANMYQNEPIAWQLLRSLPYSSYGCISTVDDLSAYANGNKTCTNTTLNDNWFAMTTKAIDKTSIGVVKADFVGGERIPTTFHVDYPKTSLYNSIHSLNNTVKANAADSALIAPRDLSQSLNMYSYVYQYTPSYFEDVGSDTVRHSVFAPLNSSDPTSMIPELGSDIFTPFHFDMETHVLTTKTLNPDYVIPTKDLIFYNEYWNSVTYNDNDTCNYTNFYFGYDVDGNWHSESYTGCTAPGRNSAINSSQKYVRPATYLNLDDVVFAVSNGTTSGKGTVKELPNANTANYSSIIDYTAGYDNMKLRVKSNDLSVDLGSITKDTSANITQIHPDTTVHLQVKANNNVSGASVSALLFNEDGNFKYYIPLDDAKGIDDYYSYDLDLTGIPKGKYMVSVVNEIYDETSTAPAKSSQLSLAAPLEIVDHLSNPHWKTNLQNQDFFETGRNANKDDVIGSISSSNGAQKIKYTLKPAASGSDVSNKFKLKTDSQGNLIYNSDSSVDLIATENLVAGSYRFRIHAVDSNGYPAPDGVTSTDQEIIVYPSSSQITFTPTKNNGNWLNVDSITSTSSLGVLSLDPAFSLSGISVTYSIKNVSADGAAYDDLEITSANAILGKITAKGTPKAGKHTFTAVVTFKKGNETYTIEKQNQELVIAPSLYFVKASGSTDKITELKHTFTDAATDQNFVVYAAGSSSIQYRIKTSSASDGVVSLVNGNSGIFKMEKPGTTYIEAYVMDGNSEIACAQLKVIIDNGTLKNLVITKDNTKITGGKISETYVKGDEMQLGVDGLPSGCSVTYSLKDKTTADGKTLEDVIAVDASGKIMVKNASLPYQNNKVIVKTVVKKSGYADTVLETIINIEQAPQTNFNFPTNNYEEIVEAGSGTITIKFQNGGSSGDIIMTSVDARVSFDQTKITYQDLVDETITIDAYQKGDRNYKDSDTKTMKLTALKEGESKFNIDITPKKLIYGSTARFTVKSEADVTYTYEVDPSSIDIADIDANQKDTIIPKKVGNAKFIITKYVGGVESGKAYKTIKVWPKPIEVKVKDKTKKVGEALPTYELEPISGLVGSDTFGTAAFTCSANANSPKGDYAISAEFASSDVLKNYELKGGGITSGKLIVTQDEGKKAWYKIEGDEGQNGWYTGNVIIKMLSGNDYDQFSQNQSDWKQEIEFHGENVYPVELWFKNSTSLALSTSIKETIKIDGTAPMIESIKALNSNSDVENMLNDISFGNFFKPGTTIHIYTNDNKENKDIEVSKTKEIAYEIYPLDQEGNEGNANTGIAQSVNEVASITLNDTGRYKVCAVPKDHAGNTAAQKQCAKVSIKDPKKDFDPDDLGCPSVNVTLGNDKPVLNIDRDLDGIPDMDIDTDGDGKADINIDNDLDGKPDTNLVILNKWEPSICAATSSPYGYMPDIKPLLNIALDKEHKTPSLNIDSTGDFKADINVDTNNDQEADVNIMKIHSWSPNQDYLYEEFQYDTIQVDKKKELELNIDSDGDGLPDINLDIDKDGKVDLNFDNNSDWIPDVNIDSDGDGKADINIDVDGNGKPDKNIAFIEAWVPNKDDCEHDGFHYDTMSNIEVSDPIKELQHDPTGVVVEQIHAENSFKKGQYILVKDVTNTLSNAEMNEVTSLLNNKDQEVKRVLEAKLYEENVEVQPNGIIKVKIPLSEELKAMVNRKVIVQQADGSYKVIKPLIEGEFLTFETDYLGKIYFTGNKDEVNIGGNINHDDDVQKTIQGVNTIRNYASTGDHTNIYLLITLIVLSFMIMAAAWKRHKKDPE